jgi:SAM-dependent methyltransferase
MIERILRKKVSYVDLFLKNTPEAMQVRFVGSSGRSSIQEAEKFLKTIFTTDDNLLSSFVEKDSRVLDFGAGLGRFSAVLLDRGLKEGNLSLVDTLDEALEQLEKTFKKSKVSKVGPKLENFAANNQNSFSGIFAYSIFSHLPSELATFTLLKIHSMLKNGGRLVFTFWDPEILPVMQRLGLQSSNNVWAEQFANSFMHFSRDDFDSKGVIYSPSGGGDGLDTDVYGDTIMTHTYISELLRELGFSEVAIIRSGEATLQAVVIAQK